MQSRAEEPLMGSPASERVIETVAVREGIDPVDLEPPLYEAIDTEALDAVFTAPGDGTATSLEVAFTYCGYDLRVTRDDVEILESS